MTRDNTLGSLVATANRLCAKIDAAFDAVHPTAWRELYEQPHIQKLFQQWKAARLAIARARWDGEV